MKKTATIFLLFFICTLLYSQHTFNDITSQMGIGGFTGLGHAVGWGDVDNDGDPDFAVSNQDGTGFWFYRNDITTFTNITNQAGLGGLSGDKMIFAEVTGDDLPDLILKPRSSGQYLFKSNGDGTFTNITAASNISGSIYNVADFDNNGFLDLVSIAGDDISILYNNGNETFESPQVIGPFLSSWGVVCLDYDNDGLMDIYGTTYGDSPNRLYKNNGDGTFEDRTMQAGVNYSQAAHGLDVGDYNNDGFTDIYVGSYSSLNCKLFKNNGDGTFTDVSSQTGTTGHHDTRTVTFVDYNNDGWLDIFSSHHDFFVYSNTLLRSNNGNNFTNVANSMNLSGEWIGDYFGVGWADYNNDGAMDLFAAGHIDKYNLFQNENCPNNYLNLKLIGAYSNYSAIGSRVKVWAGGQMFARSLLANGGLHDFSAIRLHFGLNDNFLIDSLEIIWPGGIIQRLENIPANQQLTVVEDSTTTGVFDSGARKRIILEVFPNPVDHSTTINYQLTVKGLVALTVYDIYGKVVATLVDNEQERGEYKFQWRISDNIIPGIYLLRLTTNQEIAMRKIIIK